MASQRWTQLFGPEDSRKSRAGILRHAILSLDPMSGRKQLLTAI